MEIAYKRNIKQSFMVLIADEIVTDYQIEMCTRNKIAGLLELETVVADGRLQFWYDITGKQSLEEYMKNHHMQEQQLVSLIGAVRDVAANLTGYLLEENHIQLEMRTIYIDNSNQQFSFCYFPKEQRPLTESFHFLMEYLLTRIEHSDKQVVAIAYETYQMTLQEGYSIEKIYQIAAQSGRFVHTLSNREYEDKTEVEQQALQVREEQALDGTGNQTAYSTKNQLVNQTNRFGKVKEQIRNVVSGIDGKTYSWKIRKSKADQLKMVFEPEEEICQEESGYTVFLGEQSDSKELTGFLEYAGVEARPNLVISKTPYHIGSRGDADGVIDKKSISRLHARITRDKDEYFIEDLNSRNGTWVNGELLNYLDKVRLVTGTKITFAREEYCFFIK